VKFDLSPLVLYSDNRMRMEVFYYGIEGTGQIGIFKPSFEFIYADGEFVPGPITPALPFPEHQGVCGVRRPEASDQQGLQPYIAVRYATGDDNATDNDVEGFVGITDIGRFTRSWGWTGTSSGSRWGIRTETFCIPTPRRGGSPPTGTAGSATMVPGTTPGT
jgi:hypothetical protein